MKKISSCSVQGMVCRLHFTQNYLAALEQKGWKSRKARCAPDADIRAGTIYVFSPLGPLLRTLSIGDTTCAHEAVASHNNDDVLMVGGKSGIVSAWDLESGVRLSDCGTHYSPITCLALADRTRLCVGYNEPVVQVLDRTAGTLLRALIGHEAHITQLITNDGILVSASADGTARVWRVESGECLQVLAGVDRSIARLAWLDGGAKVATGGKAGEIRVWNVRDGDRFACANMNLNPETGQVVTELLPWGNLLISTANDDLIRVWDWRKGALAAIKAVHGAGLQVALVVGEKVVFGNRNGTLQVWRPEAGEEVETLVEAGRGYEWERCSELAIKNGVLAVGISRGKVVWKNEAEVMNLETEIQVWDAG